MQPLLQENPVLQLHETGDSELNSAMQHWWWNERAKKMCTRNNISRCLEFKKQLEDKNRADSARRMFD